MTQDKPTFLKPCKASEDFGLYQSCDEATDNWKEEWDFCPVCGARFDQEGYLVHADPKEPKN